jgi:DNA topoisomerase-1
MEEDLDLIALGEKNWVKIIDSFYQPLAKKIAAVTKEAERVQVPVEKTGENVSRMW